jgi:glycine/D-amino acid oxidase-like deaminating enzyme/nitrite reductase/ring-hydroxylating ferredoxin subunit
MAGGSLWMETTSRTAYPRLDRDLTVDVAVLGAGIAGLTTALLLERDGASVAVIEASEVAAGATGYTTAKVSSQHGAHYERVESGFGEDGARAYAESNQAAVEWIGGLIDERGIDCDWRRKPSYVYAATEEEREQVEREADAARRAGLPAYYTTETGLPWKVHGAVRFDDQAEFHPRRYLLPLAESLKGPVFEHTRATSVADGEPARVRTDAGHVVTAGHVVEATSFPFSDRGVFFARMHAERSYCIGVRTSGPLPEGMYISAASPTRSLRTAPDPEGGELLIVGGAGHKVGQSDGPTTERYAELDRFAREHFDVRSIDYRWSTQDNMPVDGVPFVGKATPLSKRHWVATGFLKWGMTNGTVAAMILADRIAGRENPWAALYDSSRVKPLASAKELLKENLNVARHFVGDHLSRPDVRHVSELAPGEGGIVRDGTRKLAAYRDEEAKLYVVSSVCTHLGCQVAWNAAERSWDCPCHGSRFHWDGTVLQGPAVKGLDPRSPPAG